MAKQKIKNDLSNITGNELIKKYDEDIQYSLEIDPENKYNFTKEEIKFLKIYIDTKSIHAASVLSSFNINDAFDLVESYKGQMEIRRINQALYKRRFAQKILTLDEISAWLSSGITDEGTTSSERFSVKDKLRAAQMLIDLQTLKSSGLENPDEVLYKDIEQDVKHLSLSSIKKLIHQQSIDDQLNEKIKIIDKLNIDNVFTSEEITYLKTLTIEELRKMLKDVQQELSINVKGE